jgi:hypothetical protein
MLLYKMTSLALPLVVAAFDRDIKFMFIVANFRFSQALDESSFRVVFVMVFQTKEDQVVFRGVRWVLVYVGELTFLAPEIAIKAITDCTPTSRS